VKVAKQVLKTSEVVKGFACIKHDAYAGQEIRERSRWHARGTEVIQLAKI
jgi:hypothetical protein